jgi:hypothetical protein
MGLRQLRYVTLIVILFAIAIVLFTPNSVRTLWKPIAAKSAWQSLRSVWLLDRNSSAVSDQCGFVIEKGIRTRKIKMSTDAVETPPWFDLMRQNADHVGTPSVDDVQIMNSINKTLDRPHKPKLYIRASGAEVRRLGNQLFDYASLFGVAWRNRRIPLWPAGPTQVSRAFQLRVPLDVDRLMAVRIVQLYFMINCKKISSSK